MSMILRKEGPCEFNRRLIMCQQDVGDAHMIAKKFYPRGRWCECEFKSKVQRGCQQRSKLLCNVQLSFYIYHTTYNNNNKNMKNMLRWFSQYV